MNGDLRVLIADDDSGMRMILRRLIEKADGFTLAGEASDGKQAIELAEAQYDGAYAMAWGRYDVKTGCWSVVFSEDSSGGNTVTRNVDSDGPVSDEEPQRCREGAMEDGEK